MDQQTKTPGRIETINGTEGLNGGHDWDRTSDPYDVNVVLSR
jgi:hypothetical protein